MAPTGTLHDSNYRTWFRGRRSAEEDGGALKIIEGNNDGPISIGSSRFFDNYPQDISAEDPFGGENSPVIKDCAFD